MTEQNTQYFKQGLAAILLAILFPIYWSSIFIFSSHSEGYLGPLEAEIMTFGAIDVLFIIIGMLEIYLYVSLSKAITEQINSSICKVLLLVMVTSVAIFHSLVFIDLFLHFSASTMSQESMDSIVGTYIFLSIAMLIIYTVAGLGLSIVLMLNNQNISNLLKYFAAVLFIICLFQITVFMAIINIVLFPIAMIVLAMFFFKDPETLEVV